MTLDENDEPTGHFAEMESLSYESAIYLRELSRLLIDSVGEEAVPVELARPTKGQYLQKDFWKILRELVNAAERKLSEHQQSSLARMLGRFYSPARTDLVNRLNSPSDHLLEMVEHYVCPLIDNGQGRPRNNQAQRRMRSVRSDKYPYDIGHFLPHSVGGPKDINLFVQERRLNRGWSEQGKRYRWIEKVVFSHPGTFFFVRPVYGDLSPIPQYLEWGVLLNDDLVAKLSMEIERMPGLHLICPGDVKHCGPKLSLLLSVFKNFDAEAVKYLMENCEARIGR